MKSTTGETVASIQRDKEGINTAIKHQMKREAGKEIRERERERDKDQQCYRTVMIHMGISVISQFEGTELG